MRQLAPLLLAVLLLTGCASSKPHPEFTHDRAERLYQTMTPKEIVRLFGPPNQQQLITAGQESPGGPWPALVYIYEMDPDDPRSANRLFFDQRLSPPSLLAHYDLATVYSSKK